MKYPVKYTKDDLVDSLTESQLVPTRAAAERVVNHVLDDLKAAICRQGVAIRGLGTFEPKLRAARTARDMATGQPIAIPERVRLKFKPSPRLLQQLEE